MHTQNGTIIDPHVCKFQQVNHCWSSQKWPLPSGTFSELKKGTSLIFYRTTFAWISRFRTTVFFLILLCNNSSHFSELFTHLSSWFFRCIHPPRVISFMALTTTCTIHPFTIWMEATWDTRSTHDKHYRHPTHGKSKAQFSSNSTFTGIDRNTNSELSAACSATCFYRHHIRWLVGRECSGSHSRGLP